MEDRSTLKEDTPNQFVIHPTLQTPDEYFKDIKDFPYEPRYKSCLGYNIHYVDEGDPDAPVILLLHGEPTWSFLYRKMIPPLIEKGYRVIAPDLLGFGRSDKLVRKEDYSYQLLVDIKTEFVRQLDEDIAVLFIQDWGSLVGLRLLETVGDRIERVLLSNGALSSARGWKGWIGNFLFQLRLRFKGKVTREDLSEDTSFLNWVAYSRTADEFPVGEIIQGASVVELTDDELKGYNAPFPDEDFKTGARILPSLVPTQLRKNHQVWEDVLRNWKKPFLTIFGKLDPITSGAEKKFIRDVPGAQGLDHTIIDDASHFIQEDAAPQLVEHIDTLASIPVE